MIAKTSLLSALVIGTGSLLTWGGFEANNKYQYNSRMWEYEQWREKFFRDKLAGEAYLCHNSKNLCLQDSSQKDKYYLPSSYEDDLWEKLYKSLDENRKKDKQLKTINNSHSPKQEQLSEVKNPEDLKNYCYGRVKESIEKHKDNPEENVFNLSNSGKDEERCVLGISELEK